MEFFDKTPSQIAERIDVETFCGLKILRVDGRRVGHALTDEMVESYQHYLATALPDLEQLFLELFERAIKS